MKTPAISEIKTLPASTVKKIILNAGLEVFYLTDPNAQYLHFEVVFEAGRYDEEALLTAKGCALMMQEGTSSLSRKQVAEKYDERGSSLHVRNSLDHIFVSFVSLKENARDLIPLTAEVCFDPSLNRKTLDKVVRRQKQILRNETSQTEVVAYREMTYHLFGDGPYGYNSTPERLDHLSIDDIRSFHQRKIVNGSARIFIVGNVDPSVFDTITSTFSQSRTLPTPIRTMVVDAPPPFQYIEMADSVQSSLRMYKMLFSRRHEDYGRLFLLNTLFGGYFGSRLMKNIREHEGLTYGIYSSVDTFLHGGYFYISTETQHKNVERVLALITEELEKVTTTPVSAAELLTVRRYLAGQFLHMVDGPLNVMKLHKSLCLEGLETTFYHELLDNFWTTSAEDLFQISQKYLQASSFKTIVVGKKNT